MSSSLDIDECSNASRQYFCTRGTCENTVGSYNCTCVNGFSGERCDQQNDNQTKESNLLTLGINVTKLCNRLIYL